MPGVKGIYRVGDTAVAVVADSFWQAKLGLDALNPKWEEGPNNKVSSETIAATLREGLTSKDGVFVGNKAGDADAAIAGAAKKIEAVYENPYRHHVTMEPMNCTAQVDGGEVRGVGRHAERRGLPGGLRGSRRPAALASARSTSTTWAAASAGAASRTTRPRPCCLPSRFRACP